jgi:beta-phosphoglucomutase-like phosphatase (HAD superfamily)
MSALSEKLAGIEAIIFDMDGTLVDNMQYHYESWVIFFSEAWH